jgi:serine/threonine protein kinase
MAERIDRIGQRFGDYVLQCRLGGGSFGDVYLGEQVHEHSLAAVKVLHIRLTRSEDLRAFINEVRTFRLQHPHIVRMLDVGLAQDETPFLVMTYAPGGTLRDRHPKGSRLSPAQVLSYVLPIASALQYAHDLHLIHRDVKPENLLLGAREELWLSDFGIVTVAHSTHTLTAEAMGGTVPYMAPEQIQGRPRLQSDQYALAIVVYEWLTGTWPFRGTAFEIAMQHQMTPPPALRTQVPELAPEVEQVVLRALAKDPKQRFASVLAFARALEQASQAESTLVEPPPAFLMPDATSGVLQEEQHLPAEEERVRPAREEKQASQVKQPEPAPAVPVAEATDINSSQQPAEMATPILPMPVSQQTVGEVSTDIASQPQTLLPLSGEERLRQAEEERRQAERERSRQEKEQAANFEEERAREVEETGLVATEPAISARPSQPTTEVARVSKPPHYDRMRWWESSPRNPAPRDVSSCWGWQGW